MESGGEAMGTRSFEGITVTNGPALKKEIRFSNELCSSSLYLSGLIMIQLTQRRNEPPCLKKFFNSRHFPTKGDIRDNTSFMGRSTDIGWSYQMRSRPR